MNNGTSLIKTPEEKSIFHSYYLFKRNDKARSKSRYEAESVYNPYAPLECHGKNGKPYLYYYDAKEIVKADSKRKPDRCFQSKHYVSGVFFPYIEIPSLAYGDFIGTDDCFIVLFGEDTQSFEIFICDNKKYMIHSIVQMFLDGEFDKEVEICRAINN